MYDTPTESVDISSRIITTYSALQYNNVNELESRFRAVKIRYRAAGEGRESDTDRNSYRRRN